MLEISISDCFCKYVLKQTMEQFSDAFRTFFRLSLVPSKIKKMHIPKVESLIKIPHWTFIDNSMSKEFANFLEQREPGTSVFWAPESTGKTFTFAHIAKQFKHEFVYYDCRNIQDPNHLELFYFQKMGLRADNNRDDFLAYLACRPFTTLIFDHVDCITSYEFLTYLNQQSLQSKFNILLLLNNPKNAESLLTCNRGVFRFKLLGHNGCGKWSSSQLPQTLSPNIKLNIDQCGTLMPILCQSTPNIILRMQVINAENAWNEAEDMFEFYWIEVP